MIDEEICFYQVVSRISYEGVIHESELFADYDEAERYMEKAVKDPYRGLFERYEIVEQWISKETILKALEMSEEAQCKTRT